MLAYSGKCCFSSVNIGSVLKLSCLLLAAALLLVLATSAVVSASDGGDQLMVNRTVVLNATMDAYKRVWYARWGYAETNFCGTWTIMMVGYYNYVSGYIDNSYYFSSLIYFDLSGIPENATVNYAYLRIYYIGMAYRANDRDGDVYRVYLAEQEWSERDYRVRDPNTPVPPYGLQPPYVRLNISDYEPESWVSVNVTDLVQAIVNGSHFNYGFAISFRRSELAGWDGASRFATKESGLDPQLVIQYTAPNSVPEVSLTGPSNGTVYAPTASSAQLSWSGFDFDGDSLVYNVYFGEDPGELQLVAQNITSEEYNVTGLQPGKTYYWRVSAEDPYGAVGVSGLGYFEVASPPDLVIADVGVEPSPVYVGESLNVTVWVSNVGGYGTQHYGLFDIKVMLDGQLCGQRGDASLEAGETLVFKCSGCVPSGTGEYNLTVTVDSANTVHESNESNNVYSMAVTVPNRPPTLTVTTPNNTVVSSVNPTVTLTWVGSDPDGDTVSYNLYFGENPNPPVYMSDLAETQATVDLEPGRTYYWKVTVSDGKGGVFESPLHIVLVDPRNRIRDSLSAGEQKEYSPLDSVKLNVAASGDASIDVLVREARDPEEFGVPGVTARLFILKTFSINGSVSNIHGFTAEIGYDGSVKPEVYVYVPEGKGAAVSGWINITEDTVWNRSRGTVAVDLSAAASTLGVSLEVLLEDPVFAVGFAMPHSVFSVPPEILEEWSKARSDVGEILELLGLNLTSPISSSSTKAEFDINRDGKVDLEDAYARLKTIDLIRIDPPTLQPQLAHKFMGELEKHYGPSLENYPTVDGRIYLLYMILYLPNSE